MTTKNPPPRYMTHQLAAVRRCNNELRTNLDRMTGFMHEAKQAHTEFEQHHGQDPHWELFYGSFVRGRIYGLSYPDAYDAAVIDVLGSSGI